MYVKRNNPDQLSTMNLRDLAWALNNLEADAQRTKSSLERTNYHLDRADGHSEAENRLYELYEEQRTEYEAILAELDETFAVYSLRRLAPR